MNLKHTYELYSQRIHKKVFLFLIFVLTIIASSGFGQATNSKLELQVKAAYIYNFTKFIYWNTNESDTAKSLITIVVLGTDPIGDLLENFLMKQAKGRPIIVKRLTEGKMDISGCNLLFISQSVQRQLPVILKQLKGANVLTVSDISKFTRHGGMIGFIIENNRVKIEINLDKVNKAGLKISAKLLEVARIVPSED